MSGDTELRAALISLADHWDEVATHLGFEPNLKAAFWEHARQVREIVAGEQR